jgi:DNA-binding XRE family transcriptional regulator
MTADEFKVWRKMMRLSQVAAAQALGLSKTSIELYERGSRRDDQRPVHIPRTVALACAAVFAGLAPWGGHVDP